MGIKENRGGTRPGAGRPATGRERSSLTTTIGSGTKAKIKSLKLSRKTGKFIDEMVENIYLLAKQADDFEYSVRNFVFRAVANRNIFYGESIRELLDQMRSYDSADDAQRERYKRLDSMYKYGEIDGELTRPFL